VDGLRRVSTEVKAFDGSAGPSAGGPAAVCDVIAEEWQVADVAWPPADLEALVREAEAKGLWLFAGYQQLWFSPKGLRAAWADGRFRWGAVNWQLRDPQERVKELEAAVRAAEQDLKTFRFQMMNASK